jgi:tRNA (guanine37-N1)-methyltransferase
MKFDVITLFPEMFKGPLTESILKRAQEKGLIDIKLHQLRDYATDKHKTIDDTPCGGGAGMILKIDVVDAAISNIKNKISKSKESRTILLAPSGEKFTQQKAIELSKYDNIILVCGHYEGFDQRIHEHLVDEEISIGDYVLTGGELPAMVMIDTISRMVPGVIKEESALNESFMSSESNKANEANSANKLFYDYPVYTRPIEYKGWKVPGVLLSGDHKKIDKWRKSQIE